MATHVLVSGDLPAEIEGRQILASRRLQWALMLTFIFFVVHGTFSFESAGKVVGGFLPGAAEFPRQHGILGYVIFPVIAYSTVVWLIWSRLSVVVSFLRHFKLLTFLALLTICSAAWSQDPLRSVLFGSFYFAGTLFAYSLVIRFEQEEIMTLVTRTGVVVSVLGLIMVLLLPQFGLSHSDPRSPVTWNGIFIDRTTAAKVSVFLMSPLLIATGKRFTRGRIIAIMLYSLMIFEAHAVTAIMVLITYILFLAFLRVSRKLEPRLSLLLVVFGSVFIVLIAIGSVEYLPDILQGLGRDPTLTGRTLIWSALIGSILKHPVLGYGFYAFWNGLSGESGNVINATHWTFGYAHNGLIEIFLQLGSLGALIFLATLVQAMRNAWFCFRNDTSGRYDWYLGLIALTVAYNVDEATVLLPNEFLSIMYVIACCGLALAANQVKSNLRFQGVRESDGTRLSLAR
jgi:exopolysaccharide production protein ExoQ